MVQPVLTIAGGILGSFVGMPQLGAMIGSVVGGLIDPQKLPDAVGPRLNDLKVTASTYGNMISILFGTIKTGGNIIFSTPKIEQENSRNVGGKGGPTQKQISYQYFQSVMVALCEGPILGVIEIEADGEVIWTNSSGAPTTSIIASSAIASGIRVYTGSEDQRPDPFIQAYAGIENTSAYRGTACVFFEKFDITKYQRLPNLTFKVVRAGQNSVRKEQVYNTEFGMRINISNQIYQTGFIQRRGENNIYGINVVRLMANGVYEEILTNVRLRLNIPGNAPTIAAVTKSDDNSILLFEHYGNPGKKYYSIVDYAGQVLNMDPYFEKGDNDSNTWPTYDPIYVKKFGHVFAYLKKDQNLGDLHHVDFTKDWIPPQDKNSDVYGIIDMDVSQDFVYVLARINNGPGTSPSYAINKYNYALNFIEQVYFSTVQLQCLRVISDDEIYTQRGSTGFYEVSTGSAILKMATTSSDYNNIEFDGKNFYGSRYGTFTVITENIETIDVRLSDVVTELCEKVDLQPSDLNVESLDSLKVHGYQLTDRDTVANSLEALRKAYFFDGIESDGLFKCVRRGGSVAAVIPQKDLAAHAYESDTPDHLVIVRDQEMDLSSEVTINYLDRQGGYQIGTQYARRQNTRSVNTTTIPLALCLDPTEAKNIADALLESIWKGRKVITFTLPIQYSYLEPTDIVQVESYNTSHTLRITEIEEQNGILSVVAVTEDTSTYQQESIGVPIPAPVVDIQLPSPTRLELLDIPLLRDQDDKKGFYFAASGYTTGWTGASILKSSDGGSSYSDIGVLASKKALLGTTQTSLGDFFSGNIPDEVNSVTVTTNGINSLESVSRDAILNGANVCLVGDEIIQYRTATLSGTNRYILRGLIRGKKGTERAMSSHKTNERFVFLTTDMLDILASSTVDYDVDRFYKAVSFNEYASDAIPKSFRNTGVAQECYNPVHLGGGKNSNGFTLKWIRRGRISNEWNNKIDVPLGEDKEAYEIEILDNLNNVKRVISSNTNAVSYTNAMMVTDFGSVQSNCKFRVYQLSTLRGRGFPAEATI